MREGSSRQVPEVRQRARRRALLLGQAGPASDELSTLAPVLEALGFSVDSSLGSDESARDRWAVFVDETRADDVLLIHYLGPGLAVPSDLQKRTGLVQSTASDVLARLGLSRTSWLELHERCDNLTLIFSTWAAERAEPGNPVEVDPAPLPDELPIVISSAPRPSATGLVIRALTELLWEWGSQVERVVWGALECVLHERVLEAASSAPDEVDELWLAIAGPRERLLLSRSAIELEDLFVVGYRPDPEPGSGWLDVGLLRGLRQGDRVVIVDSLCSEDLELQPIASASVAQVGLDQARVIIESGSRQSPRSLALVLDPGERVPIDLVGPSAALSSLRTAIAATPGLWPTSVAEPLARVEIGDAVVEIRGPDGELLRRSEWSSDDSHVRSVVAHLEDLARVDLLRAALDEGEPTPTGQLPLRWRCLVQDDFGGRPLPERVYEGERLVVELERIGSDEPDWTIALVELAPSGRLRSLHPEAPRGVPLTGKGRRAFELLTRWPDELPRDRPRTVSLISLASRRPIPMDRLIPAPADPRRTEWSSPGALRLSSGSKGPALGWAWAHVDFLLVPRPSPR